MRFHKQRFKHEPEKGVFGDCHRTAIACLLDLNPEQVPHFGIHFGDGEAFHKMVDEFLASRGLADVDVPFKADLDAVLEHMGHINPEAYYLFAGTSKTGCNHTVIGHGNKIVWDPSLTDAGIVGPCSDGYYWVTFLVPHFMTAPQTALAEAA